MKQITVTEKRFYEWYEDDVAVTLRHKGGSYGGGRKSSSFAIAIDFYNHKITGDKTMTLNACRMDVHKIPCVLIANSSGGGISGTLDSSYYKGSGERQGIEREFVVVMADETINRHDSRPSDPEV